MRRTITAGLLTLALSVGTASGIERTAEVTVGGLELPEYIGPLEYIGERSGGELEKSARYAYQAHGLALDIYVADYGAEGLPDGLESQQLLRRIEEIRAQADAEAFAREGQLTQESIVQLLPQGGPAAHEVSYATGGIMRHVWLTTLHGLLVEAHLQIEPGFEEEGRISRSEVREALGRALPESAEEVQLARAKAAEAPKVEVAILWDPATPPNEHRIWVTYLFTRAAYAVNEREASDVTLGEREASFEEEVRARTVAVNTFRAMKAQDETLVSSYFSEIDRVEAAGFLREYVWRYLKRKSWTTMPPGLDLRAFDEWRRTNLPDHVPVTRGRIAFKLASAQ